jgi:nuclear pore complex protein Nup93
LLAASGVSTAATLRDLNNFSAQAGAGIAPPNTRVADTDIESFVSNLQTQSTLDMIQEGLEQSKRDFDTYLEENVQMNWDAQRRRIYEHFGLVKPSENLEQSTSGALGESSRERGAFGRSSRRQRPLGASAAGMSFGQSGMARSVLGTSTMRGSVRGNTFTDLPDKASGSLASGTEDRLQRDKQEKYAEKVRDLNAHRIGEVCYPVLATFAEAEQDAGIDSTASMINAYKALVSITKEPPKVRQHTDQDAIKERQFVRQYLDEVSSSQQSMNLRKQIIQGSRSCLEQMFFKKVNVMIEKDPKVAMVGGTPSTINTLRGYIRILENRKELGEASLLQTLSVKEGDITNVDFCWVLIYTLLRCGYVDEAAQYVIANQKAIRSIDRSFTRYMELYAKSPDRRLAQDVRQHVNNEYHSRMRSAPDDSLDPYRMACYKIIGRCELSRRVLDNIRTDEEDWIWLQFALAREVPKIEEMAGEVFGLEQIQETVKDIGRRHFAQGSDSPGGFGTFFFLQILAGMFEKAVAWLYPHNHISAVHFAIALDYYGLLRVADLTATELSKLDTTLLL